MMTQDAIKKIEEQIRKDGSLSEERKTELLNLLTTMKPEMTKFTNLKQNTQGMNRFGKHPTVETMRQENKHKN